MSMSFNGRAAVPVVVLAGEKQLFSGFVSVVVDLLLVVRPAPLPQQSKTEGISKV